MPSQDAIYRFGPFELRSRTRELFKHGIRLKLRPQPFQILHALLEHGGDVVTREELRQLLWPAETFVDFEHGLNTSIKELRGLLNDSATEPRYIETLPKLGYRILVPVESDFHVPSKEAVTPQRASNRQSTAPVIESSTRTWHLLFLGRWPIPVAIIVVLIAGLAAYVHWSPSAARSQASNERAMLAVLPFENLTGDATQDYFSDGLTEEMIGLLGRLDPQHLGVIARTSVMHYKRTQQPLPQIGRELGVQYVLEGSVRRDSDKVRISAHLIQMKDQTHLWSRQYDRAVGGLLALQSEISQEIADEIQLTLGGKHKVSAAGRLAAASATTSYEAYDLYLKGRYFWNKRTPEGFRQAAEYFQEAIGKDPNYARPYAGLADAFALMSTWYWVPQNEFMPKARAAALRALQIDEGLAEAHASLALIAEQYDYDWQAAEKEFKRAIELDPSYPTAHQWYAECLSLQGRFEEALAESERARQLDPLSLIIATDRGWILFFSRQYDRAIAQCRTVLDMDPSFGLARGLLIYAYVQEGKFPEALKEFERGRTELMSATSPGSSPGDWAMKAYIYGRWGRTAEAQQSLAKFEQLLPQMGPDRTPARLLAYIGTGQKDRVIAILQSAYSEHSNALIEIKVDPGCDPLRSDPRFQELLRRVHLAQ